LRKSVHHLLSKLPANAAQEIKKDIQELASATDFDIVHCIYKAMEFEVATKDCEFSRMSIVDRADHGYNDIKTALQHSPWLKQPQQPHIGCRVHRFITSHQASAAAQQKAKA